MSSKIGIGVNGWVWTSPFQASSLPLLAKAAEMGFDAFTVPIEDPTLIDAVEIRAISRDLELRIHVSGAFGPTRDLTHDDEIYRRESLDYIHTSLKLCEQMGATLFVGPMYSSVGKRRKVPETQRKIEWERAVGGLREAAKIARDHGVTLAIEALNRFETDLINTAAQLKKLVRNIDDSAAKMHLDTFHMNIEEANIYDAIVLAGEDLVYVDASESDRGAPGSAQVHWHDLARGLRDINYRGDCVIESFTPECEAIAAAAAIWRPLAPSQDHIASDGLKFLRRLLA